MLCEWDMRDPQDLYLNVNLKAGDKEVSPEKRGYLTLKVTMLNLGLTINDSLNRGLWRRRVFCLSVHGVQGTAF